MRLGWMVYALLAASCAKGAAVRAPIPLPLAPGHPVPALALVSHEGRPLSLADFRGKKILLWFYPAADTPG
jgi:hypothetical protein